MKINSKLEIWNIALVIEIDINFLSHFQHAKGGGGGGKGGRK